MVEPKRAPKKRLLIRDWQAAGQTVFEERESPPRDSVQLSHEANEHGPLRGRRI